MANFKCRFCKVCNGFGCIGEMPGIGGVNGNKNFQLNCAAWKKLREKASIKEMGKEIASLDFKSDVVLCAPVTGAVQNIGYDKEADFYLPYLSSAYRAGIGLSVGDGAPDEKLLLSLDAVRQLQKRENNPNIKAAVFIKPYPTKKMIERALLAKDAAKVIGCDIDASHIATMTGIATLEKKSVADLKEFRRSLDVPLAIKGVFTDEDIELIKELKPEICFISNHGGRIDTVTGSTADFLERYAAKVKPYCKEVWVDGGIRSREDVQTALFYGADKVALARPIISALCKGGEDEAIAAIGRMVN